MRFWLIKDGEPTPDKLGSSRLLRTGLLAQYLASRGHEVTWWTSSFDHFLRKQKEPSACLQSEGVSIQMLQGPGYRRTISPGRIIHNRLVAEAFRRKAQLQALPDAIVSAMPTIELSVAATEIGKKNGVPVILDLRDLWPDIFKEVLPSFFRPLISPAVNFYTNQLSKACRDATALWGITPSFLDWGLKMAGRAPNPYDAHFWHIYPNKTLSQKQIEEAKNYWTQLGLRESDFIICFMGSMSLELEPVFKAAKALADVPGLKFVLCGSGDKLGNYRKQATQFPNILMPGWLDRPQLTQLMSLSSVALAPYPDRIDFRMSIPNKAVEYLAAGLPILSSLKGTFEDFIAQNGCGMTYSGEDPSSLVESIRYVLLHSEQRILMKKNAELAFEREFQSETILAGMANRLELVARKG